MHSINVLLKQIFGLIGFSIPVIGRFCYELLSSSIFRNHSNFFIQLILNTAAWQVEHWSSHCLPIRGIHLRSQTHKLALTHATFWFAQHCAAQVCYICPLEPLGPWCPTCGLRTAFGSLVLIVCPWTPAFRSVSIDFYCRDCSTNFM